MPAAQLRTQGRRPRLPERRAQYRLFAADLLQRQLTAFVVQFFEAIKAVTAITHHGAGLADISELLGESSSPTLARIIFCSVVMVVLQSAEAGRYATPTSSAPRLG
jgi:hypothetical protein